MTALSERLAEVLAAVEKAGNGEIDLRRKQAATACFDLIRDHGPAIAAVLRAFEVAATGRVVAAGDDDSGQPRVLVHSTREELSRGKPLVFRRVALVPLDDDGRVG